MRIGRISTLRPATLLLVPAVAASLFRTGVGYSEPVRYAEAEPTLGAVIAAQGNQALVRVREEVLASIREEVLASLRQTELPPLPPVDGDQVPHEAGSGRFDSLSKR